MSCFAGGGRSLRSNPSAGPAALRNLPQLVPHKTTPVQNGASEAIRKVKLLSFTGLCSFAFSVFKWFFQGTDYACGFTAWPTFGFAAMKYTWNFDWQLNYVGAGGTGRCEPARQNHPAAAGGSALQQTGLVTPMSLCGPWQTLKTSTPPQPAARHDLPPHRELEHAFRRHPVLGLHVAHAAEEGGGLVPRGAGAARLPGHLWVQGAATCTEQRGGLSNTWRDSLIQSYPRVAACMP
jgi:hypothetical protein